jgi:uncharacterized membrane protein YvbJ
MDAEKYVSLYFGGKEQAVSSLEKAINLYNNDRRKTKKVLKRIEEYKKLLEEIKSLPNE